MDVSVSVDSSQITYLNLDDLVSTENKSSFPLNPRAFPPEFSDFAYREGNIKIIQGPWNEREITYLKQISNKSTRNIRNLFLKKFGQTRYFDDFNNKLHELQQKESPKLLQDLYYTSDDAH